MNGIDLPPNSALFDVFPAVLFSTADFKRGGVGLSSLLASLRVRESEAQPPGIG
jgi:hypothetical protein